MTEQLEIPQPRPTRVTILANQINEANIFKTLEKNYRLIMQNLRQFDTRPPNFFME